MKFETAARKSAHGVDDGIGAKPGESKRTGPVGRRIKGQFRLSSRKALSAFQLGEVFVNDDKLLTGDISHGNTSNDM